ncbi:MAG: hypothetical protein IIA14_05895 [SAR324 cluster bacterium]|nr:hypothetical protein [SAR324 cluster bacterium]
MGEQYNDAELMAVVISREVRNDEISATGALSPIPAAGLLLAGRCGVAIIMAVDSFGRIDSCFQRPSSNANAQSENQACP